MELKIVNTDPKKSFRTYMLANLAANHVRAMPVLYRLARLHMIGGIAV